MTTNLNESAPVEQTAKRGGWKKGQSGNPSGRPKDHRDLTKRYLVKHGTDAAKVVVQIMSDRDATIKDRLKAAELVLKYVGIEPERRVEVKHDFVSSLMEIGKQLNRAQSIDGTAVDVTPQPVPSTKASAILTAGRTQATEQTVVDAAHTGDDDEDADDGEADSYPGNRSSPQPMKLNFDVLAHDDGATGDAKSERRSIMVGHTIGERQSISEKQPNLSLSAVARLLAPKPKKKTGPKPGTKYKRVLIPGKLRPPRRNRKANTEAN